MVMFQQESTDRETAVSYLSSVCGDTATGQRRKWIQAVHISPTMLTFINPQLFTTHFSFAG